MRAKQEHAVREKKQNVRLRESHMYRNWDDAALVLTHMKIKSMDLHPLLLQNIT